MVGFLGCSMQFCWIWWSMWVPSKSGCLMILSFKDHADSAVKFPGKKQWWITQLVEIESWPRPRLASAPWCVPGSHKHNPPGSLMHTCFSLLIVFTSLCIVCSHLSGAANCSLFQHVLFVLCCGRGWWEILGRFHQGFADHGHAVGFFSAPLGSPSILSWQAEVCWASSTFHCCSLGILPVHHLEESLPKQSLPRFEFLGKVDVFSRVISQTLLCPRIQHDF